MAHALDMPRAAIPRSRRIKRWLLARPGLARLGVVILLLIVWEIAARFFVDKIFLAPPSQVFTQIHTVFLTNGVPNALRITAWELGLAFSLSVVIGLVVGLAVVVVPIACSSSACVVHSIRSRLLTGPSSMRKVARSHDSVRTTASAPRILPTSASTTLPSAKWISPDPFGARISSLPVFRP